MLNKIIRTSIERRFLVLVAATIMLLWGGWTAHKMAVDVLPDLTAPTVTIGTEAKGLAPQEVERLITQQVESAMQGVVGVRRVRSNSFVGLSMVHVEFEWDTEIMRARQVVAERLQAVVGSLPPGTPTPMLMPISSIMGEILYTALESDRHTPMELREIAEWDVRRQLLAVPGVSQVTPNGGEVRQFQAVLKQDRLLAHRLTAEEVAEAVNDAGENVSAGFLMHQGQEHIIQGLGRVKNLDDLSETLINTRSGAALRLKDIADVKIGHALKLGEGSHNGKRAVILSIQKQPSANTLELTKRLDKAMDDIQTRLPEGMKLEKYVFRQADFISVAISNVSDALRDGTILVIIVVGLFLAHMRASIITAVAVPLSLVAAVLVLKFSGATLNTMTLGGMTLAIGDLVDDAIVDVENVLRRLRENGLKPLAERLPVLDVVYNASMEIRSSIIYATAIVCVVFAPLYFLDGIEGRLLLPLGIAFTVGLGASLLIALTVTPAMCAWLLPNAIHDKDAEEGRLARWIKAHYNPVLGWAMNRWKLLTAISLAGLVASGIGVGLAGRSFLPDFNEGSLTITFLAVPGTPLDVSNELGRQAELILMKHPEVVATARRTGRADLDEHGKGVSGAEIEVSLKMKKRSKEDFLSAIRKDLGTIPGTKASVGQPISHRVDAMLSGSKSAIAVKVYGTDRQEIRRLTQAIKREMGTIPGVVDLDVEAETDLPQLSVQPDRAMLSASGLSAKEFAHALEIAFVGKTVGQVWEGNRTFDIAVKMEPSSMDGEKVKSYLISTPKGPVPLSQLAKVVFERSPEYIPREHNMRKIAVNCNVEGRDLFSVVNDVKARVNESVPLPPGYRVAYGGQFESAEEATNTILIVGIGAILAVFGLLYMALKSTRDALLVMVNLPLSWMGGVVGLWVSGGILSVATLIGFICLFGIATRNGIMLVTHIHQLYDEGIRGFSGIHQAAMERVNPILMTAISAAPALMPILLRKDAPGSEIQAPMAFVILFGLATSTFLNMFVVPSLYLRFGDKRK